ncbi:HNH endonuclease [Cronobacter dublinensis]|uniref:HNH endonuclease n=1 Tax=Cronobacter dublinensis TaxID=413497 RepID=UPI0024AECBF9|nr:HNH endonuclease [Cronobacter dublinensis]MDI7384249.1 hypothetical protein [Cronobacter dublinensis]
MNNGLLLSANIDSLFDNGLMSFSDEGNLLISKELMKLELMEKLNISEGDKITVPTASKKYLTLRTFNYNFEWLIK